MAMSATNGRQLQKLLKRRTAPDTVPPSEIRYRVCPVPTAWDGNFPYLEDVNIHDRINVARFHRFLDTPVEVRLEIYSYFTQCPSYEEYGIEQIAYTEQVRGFGHNGQYEIRATKEQQEAYDKECNSITKTASSLLLSCRDINAEFTPIYYRTQIFYVHSLQAPIINPWFEPSKENALTHRKQTPIDNRDVEFILTGSTAQDFQLKFLHTLTQCKLSHLRSIKYDASIFRYGYIWYPAKFKFKFDFYGYDYPAQGSSNVDFEGLLHLGTVLQRCKDVLSSLQEVTLYGAGDWAVDSTYRLNRAPSTDLQDIWKQFREGPKWEEVEQNLVEGRDSNGQCTAPLPGWKITRLVLLWGWQRNVSIHEVQVHFQKPGSKKTHRGTGESAGEMSFVSTPTAAAPETSVQYNQGWSSLDFHGNWI